MTLLAQLYEMVYNPDTLAEFKFNLSDLSAYKGTASISPGSNVVFTDSNLSSYLPTETNDENGEDGNLVDNSKLPEDDEKIPGGGSEEGGETPPATEGGETPPTDGGETPPATDGGETPPTTDGGETPPASGE